MEFLPTHHSPRQGAKKVVSVVFKIDLAVITPTMRKGENVTLLHCYIVTLSDR